MSLHADKFPRRNAAFEETPQVPVLSQAQLCLLVIHFNEFSKQPISDKQPFLINNANPYSFANHTPPCHKEWHPFTFSALLPWIHLSTKAISTTEYLTPREEASGFQSPKQGFPACHGWLWWMNKPPHFPPILSFAGIPSSVQHCNSSAFGPSNFVPCLSVAHLSLVSWFPLDLISKAPFLKFF